jgi:SAM-dependent methyltransferase
VLKEELVCPVCAGACVLFDVMDFNKPCHEALIPSLGISGIPVYYARCEACGFCYAPALHAWPIEEFKARIYNEVYPRLDPDYLVKRPSDNAASLRAMFPNKPVTLRHIDYGGGHGLMADLLRGSGWDSISYDPFVDRDLAIEALGSFDLVTAFEVFEHVPDVQVLMARLRALLAPNGLILFSTLISDGHIQPGKRLDWWYVSPRNGHISLFSGKSLSVLARAQGFNRHSFSSGFHAFYDELPAWARHLFP